VSFRKLGPKITAKGKFFDHSGQKFFLKAIRLELAGPLDFHSKLVLRQRLDHLRKSHTTGLILSAEAAPSVLGIAGQADLAVIVEISIPTVAVFSNTALQKCRAMLADISAKLRGYSALVGYLIDWTAAPDQVRHVGIGVIKKRLTSLIRSLKEADPAHLIAVKHRPDLAALISLEEDLVYAEMPAVTPDELRSFVVRLHNLAEARPVVLEFGGELPGQDELVACAFGVGAAGVVAPAMRPAASSGLLGVRMLSAGELLPFVSLNGSCPPQPEQPPMVSVVICAYNAERTMRPCLESLRKLDYPNFEVVIVDDGSRDRTAEIAQDFPEFRLIRQPNKGLSVARNVGMQAAAGEIIAYTDSDCVVDPHWLTLMVRGMQENSFDGCGGPNYAPHEKGWVEAACAASPGAPCHVLLADDRAEHLAGCNMVYRKDVLIAIGGFDPQFTAAGDDVDICWRLMDAGYSLGFCPPAFVWHFRRNTVKAYYGQQKGYGRAEAMLYSKYPERFNMLGQIRWRGTIPGVARTMPGGARNRIGWTRRAAVQQVSEAQLDIVKVLPLTAEWNAGALAAFGLSLSLGITIIPALAMLMLGPIWAIYYAAKAPLEKSHEGIRARALIAWLAYSGPIARTIARYRYRKNSSKDQFELPPRQRPSIDLTGRSIRLSYWNEAWITRDRLLSKVSRLHGAIGHPTVALDSWSDADLQLEPGALTCIQIRSADEEHSGNRIKNHVAIRARLTLTGKLGLIGSISAGLAAGLLGFQSVVVVPAVVACTILICLARELLESGRRAYRAVEQSAAELGLTPLGKPTLAVGGVTKSRASSQETAEVPIIQAAEQ
jgi:glycosyltransferase involved in cell wall biosynthesis